MSNDPSRLWGRGAGAPRTSPNSVVVQTTEGLSDEFAREETVGRGGLSLDTILRIRRRAHEEFKQLSAADLNGLYQLTEDRLETLWETVQLLEERTNEEGLSDDAREARHQRLLTKLRELNRVRARYMVLQQRIQLRVMGHVPGSESTYTNKHKEVAKCILDVLDRSGERPPNSTRLLSAVDLMRGLQDRSTYRDLRRDFGDETPKTVDQWEVWARDQINVM